MKVRNDFVTNSSSSSYIVGIKKSENEVINNLLDKIMCSINNTKVTSKEELDKYFVSRYGYGSINNIERLLKSFVEDEEESFLEEYNKSLNILNENGKVYFYSLDYDEESFINVFKAVEEYGLASIIGDE